MIFEKLVPLILILIFCVSPARAADNTAQTQNDSDQQVQDFTLSGYADKGKRNWDIKGKSADISAQSIKLNNITSNFYGESDNVTLTADTGDYNRIAGKMHLEKNVVVTISSGAKMTTNSLDWDKQNKTISTEDKVKIEKENVVTTGKGVFSRPELNQASLTKDVSVDILPLPGESSKGKGFGKVVITCDGPLQIDYHKKTATFNKNVKVVTKDMVIHSDIMDVYFSSSDKKDLPKKLENIAEGSMFMGSQIDKIRAWGNVKIVRGSNVSYSDEAIYNSVDNKIILSGRPKLEIASVEDFQGALTGN
ncbi:MAG: LPS export ABC transporter periplasmic protein LptC [Candidatus Omnitrophota bacterium]|nr:LPS export ABC transporter periplasmic protein LptC [Candidatus Omnitrophota bacterium]MBU1929593.1 LPS export ABC transporter periplasmic protein LptC [Candidatus Omnitrophota bacterium]MBU2034786.1 LPS export ABC transporter periplasmic protein LptC [Candidatus Omnitrophota bacterium]MBU2221488.1 LPS export ABC transporter periplasmic protein LptC [Candidatus Omnitrophota bacterium]MBU2257723.1 LPS export ABC transporter periplasmic protein LptC [Candidatus Omnitrophota bacterium]